MRSTRRATQEAGAAPEDEDEVLGSAGRSWGGPVRAEYLSLRAHCRQRGRSGISAASEPGTIDRIRPGGGAKDSSGSDSGSSSAASPAFAGAANDLVLSGADCFFSNFGLALLFESICAPQRKIKLQQIG